MPYFETEKGSKASSEKESGNVLVVVLLVLLVMMMHAHMQKRGRDGVPQRGMALLK